MIKEQNRSGDRCHIMNKPPHWSNEFYNRAKHDPLDVGREELVEGSQVGLDRAIKVGNTREAMNCAQDIVYQILAGGGDKHDLDQPLATVSDILYRRLRQELPPLEEFETKRVALDMRAVKAFTSERHAAGQLHPDNHKVRRNNYAILEAENQRIISDSCRLLNSMCSAMEQANPEDQHLYIGKIFELFYLTNKRRQAYANETLDTDLFLGVSEFQDSPSIVFGPRHNYDLVHFNQPGNTIDFIQCKAGNSDEEYSDRISRVQGRHFSRFARHPKKYIDSISILMANDPRHTERVMRTAEEDLSSLFSEDLVGAAATSAQVLIEA